MLFVFLLSVEIQIESGCVSRLTLDYTPVSSFWYQIQRYPGVSVYVVPLYILKNCVNMLFIVFLD